MGFLVVFFGGGLGAAARHGVNVLSTHYFGSKYPIGTFLINVLGSFLIGVIAEYLALKTNLPMNMRLFLITGILGGFTTFSTFSLEVGLFYERGEGWAALIYAVASVVCAVGAMFVGMAWVRHAFAAVPS